MTFKVNPRGRVGGATKLGKIRKVGELIRLAPNHDNGGKVTATRFSSTHRNARFGREPSAMTLTVEYTAFFSRLGSSWHPNSTTFRQACVLWLTKKRNAADQPKPRSNVAKARRKYRLRELAPSLSRALGQRRP